MIAGYTYNVVVADAAYDSDALRKDTVAQDRRAVIHQRNNRLQKHSYDKVLYKLRNVIERFFID